MALHLLCSAVVLHEDGDILSWFPGTTLLPLHNGVCCVQLHVAGSPTVDGAGNTRYICGWVRNTLSRMAMAAILR